jgi:hypothetical protein
MGGGDGEGGGEQGVLEQFDHVVILKEWRTARMRVAYRT